MSVTQKILDKLKSDFLLITIQNGYNTDIIKCHSTDKSLDELQADEFDSFYIVGGQAKSTIMEGSLLEWRWIVGVRFYLSVDNDVDEGLLTQKIEGLKEDITTLYNHWMNNSGNVTAGQVEEIEQILPSIMNPYFDPGDTKGVFDLFLEIIYLT